MKAYESDRNRAPNWRPRKGRDPQGNTQNPARARGRPSGNLRQNRSLASGNVLHVPRPRADARLLK